MERRLSHETVVLLSFFLVVEDKENKIDVKKGKKIMQSINSA
jgi:hypothetical protein